MPMEKREEGARNTSNLGASILEKREIMENFNCHPSGLYQNFVSGSYTMKFYGSVGRTFRQLSDSKPPI